MSSIWREIDEPLQKEIEDLRKQEAKISKKIRKKESAANLLADGIVNITNYLTAPYRILWILKEPNLPLEKFKERPDYCEVVAGKKDLVHSTDDATRDSPWQEDGIWATIEIEDMYQMYQNFVEIAARRVMLTSYAIFVGKIPNSITDDDANKIKALQSIAVINVKKIGGGGSSKDKEIAGAYEKNKTLLKAQIETYKPQIIIGGGGNVLNCFIKDHYFETQITKPINFNAKIYNFKYDRNYYPSKDRICINAYHPSFRMGGKSNKIAAEEQDYIKKIFDAVLDWKNNFYEE